nr:hypothetical protein [uncultured Rhodoferax sp.]
MTYFTPETTHKARKPHRCTNCGQAINPGDTYIRWASFDDGACTNKMHPECLADLKANSDGEFEYTLYGGERPEIGVAS